MLELYSFEASPFARPVRELLCQMEIPYLLRSCGRSEASEWLPPKLRERLGIEPGSQLPNRLALLEKDDLPVSVATTESARRLNR